MATRAHRLTAAGVAVGAILGLLPPMATAAPAPPAMAVLSSPSCPTSVPSGTLWDGSDEVGAKALCERAVAAAATPQARIAIRAAFHMLGAPYACGDVGRSARFRFDCSSLVGRAYRAAGIPAAGANWAISTRDLVPWDGRRLAPWAVGIARTSIRPGDLVLYNTGAALSRHVVMYLGSGYMLHTNYCGGVAHIERFWGFPSTGSHRFLVVRRAVVPDPSAPLPRDLSASAEARASTVSLTAFLTHDRAATIRVQKALDDVAALGLLVDGRWDGGMFAAIVGFRRMKMGIPREEASGPIDRATMREIGRRAGFTLVS